MAVKARDSGIGYPPPPDGTATCYARVSLVYLSCLKRTFSITDVTPGSPFTRSVPRRSPSPPQASTLAAGQELPAREFRERLCGGSIRQVKGCPAKASVLSLDLTALLAILQVLETRTDILNSIFVISKSILTIPIP